jgi:flavin reductase (DIM6/NTAB) family NADH-FMN oxidoreductase RutF
MDFTLNLEKTMSKLKNGAFLSVRSGTKINTMTIGWGYAGIMWGKPYFMVMVRPQRYTHELLEQADDFTVSIPFRSDLNKELGICGTKSGRDTDKSEIVEFTASKTVKSPVVKGCDMYYECKIRFKQLMNGEEFPEDIKSKTYPLKDYHYMYFGEIVDCYGTEKE